MGLRDAEIVELARRPCIRQRASRGTCARTRRERARGVCRSASASIVSRQAQKSPPAALPRSARWNVWLCAFTKPGSRSVPATRRDASRVAAGIDVVLCRVLGGASPLDPERADDRALRRDPGLRLAVPRRGRRAGVGGRHLLRGGRAHRPARRLPRAALARRVGFGKVADPLADRLMIGTAAILMLATGRIPILAALVILGRDVVLVLGYGSCRPAATSSRSRSSASCHVGAVRVARLRARDAEGTDVAARAPLDRRRALPRRGRAVRAPCVAPGARGKGLSSSSTNLEGLKSQPEVDPSARLLLYSGRPSRKGRRWNHFPICRP